MTFFYCGLVRNDRVLQVVHRKGEGKEIATSHSFLAMTFFYCGLVRNDRVLQVVHRKGEGKEIATSHSFLAMTEFYRRGVAVAGAGQRLPLGGKLAKIFDF